MVLPRGLEIVEDEIDRAPPKPDHHAAFSILALSLKALSQRALIAVDNLFTLCTVGSVFWVAMTIIPHPDTFQLVGLGMYGIFVLAANWIVRRK